MPPKEKLTLLRKLLQALGLSEDGINDIVDQIINWLTVKEIEKIPGKKEYPYLIRDDFLSAAEVSFYHVLRSAVAEWAMVCPKIPLGDLFYVKSSDNSKFRTYTNKIDRKHVDFLLCDPKTMRPIMGVELDDKSHLRQDRQERDEFVKNLFLAAKLPLARIPVKFSYSVAELNSLLQSYVKGKPEEITPITQEDNTIPKCPKCGNDMVLRTAKSGANKGGKFWGCRNYPNCHGFVKFES